MSENTDKLVFVTNSTDYRLPSFGMQSIIYPFEVSDRGEEAKKEYFDYQIEWFNQFVVGEPSATLAYSVSELKQKGIIGLYKNETINSTDNCEVCAKVRLECKC